MVIPWCIVIPCICMPAIGDLDEEDELVPPNATTATTAARQAASRPETRTLRRMTETSEVEFERPPDSRAAAKRITGAGRRRRGGPCRPGLRHPEGAPHAGGVGIAEERVRPLPEPHGPDQVVGRAAHRGGPVHARAPEMEVVDRGRVLDLDAVRAGFH